MTKDLPFNHTTQNFPRRLEGGQILGRNPKDLLLIYIINYTYIHTF